jgi:hypothetical protein
LGRTAAVQKDVLLHRNKATASWAVVNDQRIGEILLIHAREDAIAPKTKRISAER